MVELVKRNPRALGGVADRLVRLQPRRDVDRAVRHAQRQEDFLAHKVGILLAAGALDDVVDHAVAEIAVLKPLAGGRHQVAVAADRFVARGRAQRFVGVKELVVQRQARGVVGHAAQGGFGRAADAGLQLGFAQVVVGRLVQLELLALDEHHQAGGRDRLGDRGHRVERVLAGGHAVLAIGPAEALLPDDLAVLGHGHGDRRHVGFDQRFGDPLAHRIELVVGRGRSEADEARDAEKEAASGKSRSHETNLPEQPQNRRKCL